MVHLTKRPLPPDVTIESEQDYRNGVVFNTLAEDCHGKCYIYESKPTTINVEHIVPHRSDSTLKFEWKNLFIACGHCNSTKGTQFDDILDPTQCDPEEHIALSIEVTDNFVERVRIDALMQDNSTLQTVELLNRVYNDGSTDIKKIECVNLRNAAIFPDIKVFLQYIRDHQEEPDLGYDVLIEKEIMRSAAFAAFKRKIVRDDPSLSLQFEQALK
jgi:hypothetical protein